MRKFISAFLVLAGCALLFAPLLQAEDKDAAKPHAYVIEIKGAITPATFDLIKRHVARASEKKADIIVLEMHTPGGLYDSTRDIIQVILDSPVPVATFVSPAGSHAASAGTYILYASHIAAMSPGTNIGSATPIQMNQPDNPKDDASMPEEGRKPGSTLEHKIVNDAAAYMRSLAELRGRNAEWAERAVREAESLSASESLSKKVIDVVADDIPSLLDKIDGKTVKMAHGATLVLKTRGAHIETIVPDWRHKILDIITHPNVAFLLMTLGFYGLVYEFANPGSFVPGIAGVICLLLGLFAMNILPINYAGLALLFLGLALMAGEAITPTFGILGISGAISFATGSMMLIESDIPGYGVDPWLIAIFTLTSLAILTLALSLVMKAHRKPATTGLEELEQATGEVLHWSKGHGEVQVTGEIWNASAGPDYILQKGDRVRILKVDGLHLTVAPAEDNA